MSGLIIFAIVLGVIGLLAFFMEPEAGLTFIFIGLAIAVFGAIFPSYKCEERLIENPVVIRGPEAIYVEFVDYNGEQSSLRLTDHKFFNMKDEDIKVYGFKNFNHYGHPILYRYYTKP